MNPTDLVKESEKLVFQTSAVMGHFYPEFICKLNDKITIVTEKEIREVFKNYNPIHIQSLDEMRVMLYVILTQKTKAEIEKLQQYR